MIPAALELAKDMLLEGKRKMVAAKLKTLSTKAEIKNVRKTFHLRRFQITTQS